ncbi:AAA family ATPase [Aliarcobacter skirrowii]|uniref:AAA family ATPase n=1 Tax=Aliarcobacter skirrowii TaxID=28200 RepID=UPI0021B2D948|nr:ATP-binding protein [Aliarcobacter skirrowii]MCT7446956.1 ATP-binding protein [Aliarcobacter skirrowii]
MAFGFGQYNDNFGNGNFYHKTDEYISSYKSHIILESLYLDNFKSFKKSKFEFGKLNCLIAPNNTGKSNLIEALEFLDNIIYENLPKAISKIGLQNIQNYHYLEDKKIVINAQFSVENRVLVSDEFIDYKMDFLFLFNMDIETKKSTIDVMSFNNKIKSINIDKADLNNGLGLRVFDSFEEFIGNYSKYVQVLEKKQYKSFDYAYNSSTLKYEIKTKYEITERLIQLLLGLEIDKKNGILEKAMDFKLLFNKSSLFMSHYFHAHDIKTRSESTGWFKLLKDGTNLVEYLSNLDKDIFEEISTSLIGEVELISSLELKDGFVSEVVFNEEVNGEKYPIKLQKVSDGTVHFVAIMSALIGNNYSIGIMIEEPERHLHMKVLSYILNNMRDCEAQIFFTTHSTEMLSELTLDEIIFMFRDFDGDTKGIRAKDIKNIKKIMRIYKNDLVEMIRIGILDGLEDEL